MTGSNPLSRLPPDWQCELRASDVRAADAGMSGATVFQVRHAGFGDVYLKMARGSDLAEFRDEIERTKWLAGRGVRVPTLLRVFDDGEVAAIIMTAVAGAHPGNARRPVAETIRALARGLAELHAHPALDCPFDETVARRLARAQDLIRHRRINPEHFADRNRGLAAQDLHERLLQSRPAHEDLVLVHGDAKFDNILVDAEGNIGFIDCGHAGRGDRYLDLEAVVTDIEEHFGPEWVESFALWYGNVRLDPEKLRFFGDLYELF